MSFFGSNDPGESLDNNGQSFDVFAILGCKSVTANATIHIASSVSSGTVAHITALAASLNKDCPNAPSIVIPIAIG